MPKGLGILEGTALMRLVCRENCEMIFKFHPFEACQFHASSAIDETTSPDKAKDGAGDGMVPAVKRFTLMDAFIDIDFL
ncbi:hypothetical protein Avbf_15882 [Armadillidium vulgare]|nr:hypothetical protein Avbf_15882 [Armadillidium vulgare]